MMIIKSNNNCVLISNGNGNGNQEITFDKVSKIIQIQGEMTCEKSLSDMHFV